MTALSRVIIDMILVNIRGTAFSHATWICLGGKHSILLDSGALLLASLRNIQDDTLSGRAVLKDDGLKIQQTVGAHGLGFVGFSISYRGRRNNFSLSNIDWVVPIDLSLMLFKISRYQCVPCKSGSSSRDPRQIEHDTKTVCVIIDTRWCFTALHILC